MSRPGIVHASRRRDTAGFAGLIVTPCRLGAVVTVGDGDTQVSVILTADEARRAAALLGEAPARQPDSVDGAPRAVVIAFPER